jgi:hypothetical protein
MNRCVVLVEGVVVGPGVVNREVVVLITRVVWAILDGITKLVAERGATVATVSNLNAKLNLIL